MQIIAQCPRCNSTWLLDDKNVDRRISCKKCNKIFRIPKLVEVPRATEVIKRAKSAVYVDESGRTFG